MEITVDRSDPASVMSVPQQQQVKGGVGISLQASKPAAPTSNPPPPPPPPAPKKMQLPAPRNQPPHLKQPPMEVRKTFEDFANPMKMKPRMPPPPPLKRREESLSGSEVGDEFSDDEDEPKGGPNDDEHGSDEDQEELYEDYEDQEEDPEELKPSEGFKTIDEEKADIIFKLHRIRKVANVPQTRQFTMGSDIREMRAELNRIKAELDIEASIKFQRKILMAVVSTMEFMNRRYDPFELQLDGWSEQVHTGIGDYDGVFERLHEKYKNKVSVAPEIELLTMVFGSAMMFHFSKTFFKQATLKMDNTMMSGMMSAMMGGGGMMPQPAAAAPPPPPPPSAPAQQQQQQQQQQQAPPQRREMQGPGMGLPGMGMMDLGSMFPMPPPPPIPPQPSTNKKSVTFAPGTKRAGPTFEELMGEEDERMSDVVSDDLASVPDDLASIGSGEDPATGTKNIRVETSKKNKRQKKDQTVIKL